MRTVASLAVEVIALIAAIWLLLNHADTQASAMWPSSASPVAAGMAPAPGL